MIKYSFHNKAKIIDYLILLKLIFRKYNIYMYNDFYIELIEYIKPIFIYSENNYFYKYNNMFTLYEFENSYNIKNKILKLFLTNQYYSKNIDNILVYINFYYEKQIYKDSTSIILFFKINFIKKYFYILNYTITSLFYEIPLIEINNLKKIKNIYLFNEYISNIWQDSCAELMYDYIISNASKKLLYYEIFKKIICRIIFQTS